MVAPATDAWIPTRFREPPDGALVEWEEGGGVVRGYRLGLAGGGLWVVPGADGPRYSRRPERWRPAPDDARRTWT
jgi:hypothetical protein